jgi:hypothetical protein
MDGPSQAVSIPSTIVYSQADRGAGLFVWGIWAFMSVGLLIYIRAFGSNVPFDDEWFLVPAVTHHQAVSLKYLWSLHNEHRIFIPRLVYLGLAKLTGGDFRAGMYLIAAGLMAIAAAMMVAAKRLRGWTSYADAFFPLVFLHVAHGENLLWSFQVTFLSSTVLVCALLLLVLRSQHTLTWRTALASGLCLVGLPLCGANGLSLVLPMAVWLAFWAIRDRVPKRPAGTVNLVMVALLSIAALVLLALYFIGFSRAGPASADWQATVRVAGQFLTSGFGFGALNWWPYVAYAHVALLVFSVAVLLLRWRQDPRTGVRCAGLLLFLLGMVGLGAAIGWGRAGYAPMLNSVGFAYRYSMAAAPVLCVVFFLGEVAGIGALARFLQMTLFACLSVLLLPNTQAGIGFGRYKFDHIHPVEKDLQPNVTCRQVAEKHHVCRDAGNMERCLEMLREAGIGKFGRLRSSVDVHGAGVGKNQPADGG